MAPSQGTQTGVVLFFAAFIQRVLRQWIPQDHVLLIVIAIATFGVIMLRDKITEYVHRDNRVDEDEEIILWFANVAVQTLIFVASAIVFAILEELFVTSAIEWYTAISLALLGIAFLFIVK